MKNVLNGQGLANVVYIQNSCHFTAENLVELVDLDHVGYLIVINFMALFYVTLKYISTFQYTSKL